MKMEDGKINYPVGPEMCSPIRRKAINGYYFDSPYAVNETDPNVRTYAGTGRSGGRAFGGG
jgi:hypothetical protein